MNIALFFGGKSAECEVSIQSAKFVFNNINHTKHKVFLIGITKQNQFKHFIGSINQIDDWEKYTSNNQVILLGGDLSAGIYNGQQLLEKIDLAFPVLHGSFGEDGTIQGLFEMMEIPYVGCGVLASAAAMDKDIAKQIFKNHKIPVLNHQILYSWQDWHENTSQIKLPCFIKPANLGSSIGISKIKNKSDINKALETAFKYDQKVMVEPAIEARELEVSVLGGKAEIQVSIVGEIIPDREFYDYDAKYSNSKSKLLIPAKLSQSDMHHLQQLAKTAFKAINGYGLARVDFFQDKQTGKFYINEVNTMPGFTEISMYPKLWQHSGLEPHQLISQLIDLALQRS